MSTQYGAKTDLANLKNWKCALAFGSFMDCYFLRFAKRFGVNTPNKMLTRTVNEFPQSVHVYERFQS